MSFQTCCKIRWSPRTSMVEHYVKDKIFETAKAGLTSTIILIDSNEGYKLNDVLSELEKDGFSYNYFSPSDNELNIELLGVIVYLPKDILWYKKIKVVFLFLLF